LLFCIVASNIYVEWHNFCVIGAVPTVRHESAVTFIDPRWTADFICINPSAEHSIIESYYRNKTKGQGIEINLDALTALTLIDEAIKKKLKQ
jgi:hypothetical protein